MIIVTCTKNATQRRKNYKQLVRECPFPISDVTLARVLREEGYDKHVPQKKPFLKEKHKATRLQFALSHLQKPVNGYWDRCIFIDEMSIDPSKHFGKEMVIRWTGEEYYLDCVSVKLEGTSAIMC
jgi:hypothetical protein